MPNNVTNVIQIINTSPAPQKNHWHETLANYFTLDHQHVFGIDFAKIIPCPLGIFQGSVGTFEQIYFQNALDWQKKHWGTKWNAYDHAQVPSTPATYVHQFDTAWAAPTSVILALASHINTPIAHWWLCECEQTWGHIQYDTDHTVKIYNVDGQYRSPSRSRLLTPQDIKEAIGNLIEREPA